MTFHPQARCVCQDGSGGGAPDPGSGRAVPWGPPWTRCEGHAGGCPSTLSAWAAHACTVRVAMGRATRLWVQVASHSVIHHGASISS